MKRCNDAAHDAESSKFAPVWYLAEERRGAQPSGGTQASLRLRHQLARRRPHQVLRNDFPEPGPTKTCSSVLTSRFERSLIPNRFTIRPACPASTTSLPLKSAVFLAT